MWNEGGRRDLRARDARLVKGTSARPLKSISCPSLTDLACSFGESGVCFHGVDRRLRSNEATSSALENFCSPPLATSQLRVRKDRHRCGSETQSGCSLASSRSDLCTLRTRLGIQGRGWRLPSLEPIIVVAFACQT